MGSFYGTIDACETTGLPTQPQTVRSRSTAEESRTQPGCAVAVQCAGRMRYPGGLDTSQYECSPSQCPFCCPPVDMLDVFAPKDVHAVV